MSLFETQDYALTRETMRLYRSQLRAFFDEKSRQRRINRFIWRLAIIVAGLWGAIYFIELINTPLLTGN